MSRPHDTRALSLTFHLAPRGAQNHAEPDEDECEHHRGDELPSLHRLAYAPPLDGDKLLGARSILVEHLLAAGPDVDDLALVQFEQLRLLTRELRPHRRPIGRQ